MATKTVINCMEHTITPQTNQGISIIIDQHTDQHQHQQPVYNGSSSSRTNIIKIQHSNDQEYFAINNKNRNNNKTLIDIKLNNDDDDCNYDNYDRLGKSINNNEEHILQINCEESKNSLTARNIKEVIEKGEISEERNFQVEVVNKGESKNSLQNTKDENSLTKNINSLTKAAAQQNKEKDKEESGQTASQQQQQQHQQLEDNGNNNENGNSKHRENGQNLTNTMTTSTTKQLQIKLSNHNEEEHKDHDHTHNDFNQDNEISKHNNDVTNREEKNHNNNHVISSSLNTEIKRDFVVSGDFSRNVKRSLYEENSNSLLTKADATTSKTLLTINANVSSDSVVNSDQQNLINDQNTNHVVKIQIKPNNKNHNLNTLAEKQITVVKIENFDKIQNENDNSSITKAQSPISEIIENKENHKETSVTQSQLNLIANMVQKPLNNNANNTVTLVASATNTNGNIANSNGTGSTVTELNVSNPNNYLYYMMSSGQFSPCDTLDSGTGSDLESNGQQQQSSPNLQLKKSSNSSAASTASTTSSKSMAPLELHLKTTKIRVASTSNSNSFTDSEESEASSLSCDSLHSNEFLRQSSTSPIQMKSSSSSATTPSNGSKRLQTLLPDSLLREIKNLKFSSNDYEAENEEEDDILPTLKTDHKKSELYDTLDSKDYIKSHEFMQSRKNLNNLPSNISSSLKRASLPSKTFVLNTEDGTFIDTKMNSMPRTYEADKYYNFHVNEHDNFRSFGNNGMGSGMNGNGDGGDSLSISDYETKSLHDDVFAGYRDLRCGSNTSTIRSSKGTVRGVKNRVRNGIATFLQLQQPNIKNYKEKDSGKVVLYTTSMGIIRDTYAKCSNVKQILRTLLVKFEERDVFMSVEYQQEIKERMHSDVIKVPQLYVEGQHIGDADTVERLNESGELRQLLKPYKSISTTYTCQTCGGYRLLPCPSCNGSKKSVHRNHFTAEFVALKCMNCDEVGLVKCHNC
ncbi:uncharacterized protein ACRADG_008797 [Cochliomyia hominivorax]